jgi:hypothetical protein
MDGGGASFVGWIGEKVNATLSNRTGEGERLFALWNKMIDSGRGRWTASHIRIRFFSIRNILTSGIPIRITAIGDI